MLYYNVFIFSVNVDSFLAEIKINVIWTRQQFLYVQFTTQIMFFRTSIKF